MLGQIKNSFKQRDMFSESFKMNIYKDHDNKPSWMGLCLTILVVLSMFLFLYPKLTAWIFRTEVDVFGAEIEFAIDYREKFNVDDGLFIAAALTEYNSDPEILEDKEVYGELVLKHYGWGYDESD